MPYNRYLGVGEEATFGEAATISKYIDIVSEDVKGDRGVVFVETVDSRYVKKQFPAAKTLKGSFDFAVEPENVAHLFKWALGSVTSTQVGTTGVYDHIFKPADSVKSFTAEIGLDTFGRKITGCLINRLTLESVVKRELVGSAEVFARDEEKITSLATPTFSNLRPFIYSDAEFTVAGSSKKQQLKAFRVTVNNNIPLEDLYGHGSNLINRIAVARLDVEGSLDLSILDSDAYDKFLAGNPVALNIKFTGEETGVPQAPNYTLEVDIPKAVYLSDSTPHLDRKEPLKSNTPFKALYDATAQYAIKIAVRNKVASY